MVNFNIMFVSGVQRSDPIIYIYTHIDKYI